MTEHLHILLKLMDIIVKKWLKNMRNLLIELLMKDNSLINKLKEQNMLDLDIITFNHIHVLIIYDLDLNKINLLFLKKKNKKNNIYLISGFFNSFIKKMRRF